MAYPQPRCPQCGGKLRMITNEQRWFCDNCQTYVDGKKTKKKNPFPVLVFPLWLLWELLIGEKEEG